MLQLLAIGIVLCVPALGCFTAPDGEDIEGLWTLSHRKPGVVEVETVQLLVRRGEGHAVSAEVSIPGVIVPFTGTFDPATGKLALVAHKGSRSATIDLVLKDGCLDGQGDLPIGQITFRGRRTVGAPASPDAVSFDVPRPSETTGDLPPGLAAQLMTLVEETALQHRVVGLSLAAAADGRVAAVLSSGWEDFEQRVPASGQTMYRWASITKPMTAIAALQLVATGDLDLHADTRDLVPEYDKGVTITADNLLAHHSGIPHSDDTLVRTPREYDDPHPWADRIVALDMFRESDLLFEPGEAYTYSTPGYVLLGAVIERAGRQPYADQVLLRIARPLGLLTLRPDYVWEEVPRRGVAYQTTDAGAMPRTWDDIAWKLPAGGWISTAGDAGRFALGLLGSDLLDDERRALMTTLRSGDVKSGKGYCLGIHRGSYDGHPVLYHGGGQVGASSFLVCSTATGHAVAVLSNTEGIDLSDLAFQALELLIDAGS